MSFAEIPGLPAASVAGHRGCLTLGDWEGQRVLLFEGRIHFYEGHSWRDVLVPIHTAAFLGARILVLTNAAGGIHDLLTPGSLMVVRDHIDWSQPQCWRLPGPGPSSPYSLRLRTLLGRAAAAALGGTLFEGVYAMVTGPCYETPAEIRALQRWGADAVGMSTAREIQAGHDAGLECAALSCIANRAAGLAGGPLHHAEVLAHAAAQSDRLADLLAEFLRLGDGKGRPATG